MILAILSPKNIYKIGNLILKKIICKMLLWSYLTFLKTCPTVWRFYPKVLKRAFDNPPERDRCLLLSGLRWCCYAPELNLDRQFHPLFSISGFFPFSSCFLRFPQYFRTMDGGKLFVWDATPNQLHLCRTASRVVYCRAKEEPLVNLQTLLYFLQ